MPARPTAFLHTLPTDDDEAIASLRPLQGLSHAEAQPLLQSAIDQARSAGRDRVQGHALCLLARSLGLADDVAAAETVAASALAIFDALADAGGQAIARNVLAMLRFTRGDHAGALDLQLEALALARPLGDAGVLGGVLNVLGATLIAVGDPQGAVQVGEECMALLPQDPGDLRFISVRLNLARALACWAEHDRDAGLPASDWRPRAERAVQLAITSIADGQAAGHAAVLSGQDSLALAWVMAGHPDRALAVLDQPEVQVAARVSTHDALHLASTRACALIELGRPSEAVAVCEAALRRAQEMGTALHTDALHLALSRAHEANGDFRQALASHRRFHAVRARLVFDRAQRRARTLVSQLDLLRAQRESRLDPLTGIANRRGFEEAAKARLSRLRPGEAIALLLIDVDHFKQVNDTQGHTAGDRALRALANVLRAVSRDAEPPARLGGDEFALLIDGGSREARALAQRVRDALHHGPGDGDAGEAAAPAFTVSIGLAGARGPCTLEALTLAADRALYAAKQGGRDRMAESTAR